VETLSIHPDRPLYEALRKMISSRARRIPLIDVDDETDRPLVVSVITQYRILRFISTNIKETQDLRLTLKELKNVGTFKNLQTVRMDTPVIDAIHLLVQHDISSIPIVDHESKFDHFGQLHSLTSLLQTKYRTSSRQSTSSLSFTVQAIMTTCN
jgi:5'-AMP-activated protein kinase regulatory gamma subunit